MVIVDAVLETYDAIDFLAWPISELPDDHLLALSGQMPPEQVRTAMAVILAYNDLITEPITDLSPTLFEQRVAESEILTAPGGLRFRDTVTNTVIKPGCCFGLENWREWQNVHDDEDFWLGHSIDHQIDRTDRAVRLVHGGLNSSAVIEIGDSELPGLLASAQQGLRGFLQLVHEWTSRHAPQLALLLPAALDTHLRISEPLEPT